MGRGLVEPTRFLRSVTGIDADWLRSQGIRALLLDIDNTLVSREAESATDEVKGWLSDLVKAGFKPCLVTNNWHRVVLQHASELGLPIVRKAMKPLPFAFIKALQILGVSRKQAVVVGDQMITDILGAHLAGMKSVLVLPLTETDLLHTRLFRKLEPLLLGDRKPEQTE